MIATINMMVMHGIIVSIMLQPCHLSRTSCHTDKNVLRIGSLSQDLGSKRWLLITKLPWWMDTPTQQGIVRRYVTAISHILDLGISLTFGVVLCAMVKSPYNREWPSHLCQEILIKKKNIYIYINRYDWVDDHSLSQGNIRSLDQRVDLASDLWTCELNRLHK